MSEIPGPLAGAFVMGIDPGMHGAAALVGLKGKSREDPVPYVAAAKRLRHYESSQFPKKRIDVSVLEELWDFDEAWRRGDKSLHVVVEQQQFRPGQGRSQFTIGFNYGRILGFLDKVTTQGVVNVSAATWKKDMGLSAKKDYSVRIHKSVFGSEPEDHNFAEAALLAWWRFRKLLTHYDRMNKTGRGG